MRQLGFAELPGYLSMSSNVRLQPVHTMNRLTTSFRAHEALSSMPPKVRRSRFATLGLLRLCSSMEVAFLGVVATQRCNSVLLLM